MEEVNKEVSEKLSKEVTSYIMSQIKEKTIEERAKISSESSLGIASSLYQMGYTKGAIDQKEIDDAELLKRIISGELIERSSAWHLPIVDEKEELIDKACEWLRFNGYTATNGWFTMKGTIEDFRKAMEE